MKKFQPIFLLTYLFFGCQESETPRIEEPSEIVIIEIELEHSPVASGQRVFFNAIHEESLPEANYNWSVQYNGNPIDEITGTTPRAYLFAKRGVGTYKISLTIESGDRKDPKV